MYARYLTKFARKSCDFSCIEACGVLGKQESRGSCWKAKVVGRLLGAYLEKEAP